MIYIFKTDTTDMISMSNLNFLLLWLVVVQMRDIKHQQQAAQTNPVNVKMKMIFFFPFFWHIKITHNSHDGKIIQLSMLLIFFVMKKKLSTRMKTRSFA